MGQPMIKAYEHRYTTSRFETSAAINWLSSCIKGLPVHTSRTLSILGGQGPTGNPAHSLLRLSSCVSSLCFWTILQISRLSKTSLGQWRSLELIFSCIFMAHLLPASRYHLSKPSGSLKLQVLQLQQGYCLSSGILDTVRCTGELYIAGLCETCHAWRASIRS
jgi:hypothetical protein